MLRPIRSETPGINQGGGLPRCGPKLLRLPIALTIFVLLAALILLVAATPASAVAGWTVHQVTSNTATDEYPCIDPNDNFVVWQSTLPAKDSEIYLWNVNTHATSALTSNSTDDQYPKVYGDYVVWQGRDADGDWEIYLYRISTHATTKLTNNSYDDTQVQIHGNLVVWVSDTITSVINVYNIATATLAQPAADFGDLLHPQTDGSWVVWQAKRMLDLDGDYEIEFWDGATVHKITDNTYKDYFPEISNHQIVWQGQDAGDYEIFYYASGATTKLTNNGLPDEEPYIDANSAGTTVVWRYYDGSDWEVRMLNKATGPSPWTYTAVTGNSVNDYPTDVTAQEVVWYGGSSNPDVYVRLSTGAVVNLGDTLFEDRYPMIGQSAIAWQGRYAAGTWEIFVAMPDTWDPEVEILSPVDGAVLSGSTAVISGTASDNLGVASVAVRIDGGAWLPATIDSGGGTAEATWHYNWSLPMEDNDIDHVISARVVDVSDSTGTSTDDPTVRVDRAGPAITGFAIDGGAAQTGSTSVTLSYTVTDGSPPMQMRFSNDGATWSSWETYAPTTPWSLTGGVGAKTVWCSFRDAHGNTSGEGLVSDSIELTAGAFTDVPAGHPYHDAIYGMRDADIIDGYQVGDTWEFRPENVVYRAQFAKMICGVMELMVAEEDWPDPAVPFTDLGSDTLPAPTVVDSLYPHEYVAVAYLDQITKGQTATTFAPYVGIKRAQVLTMIVRAVQRLHPGVLATPSASYTGSLGNFDPEHGPNMRIAEFNGLLVGLVGFGASWSPWTPASRGETAQMLWNLMALLD